MKTKRQNFVGKLGCTCD